jgi:putative ABC transport system substrate-binding protein
MRRRDFLGGLGGVAVAWPIAARGQTARARLIGLLMPFPESDKDARSWLDALKQGLHSAGWTEGTNLAYDVRYSGGRPERLPPLAADLVRANPDVIVTWAAQPIDALRAATRTIPIIMAGVGDALGPGYVESLARPGGNITGLTLVATDQTGKRLELLQTMVPGLVRVAAIWNAGASGHVFQMKDLPGAAQRLGIELQSHPVRAVEDVAMALRTSVEENAQGIYLMEDPMIQSARPQIIEFTIKQRLPVIGEFRPVAEAGALMNYGPNQLDMWRRTATYVDKILKGAKAADLPVEQPSKYDLVINMRTAKAIGITVPDSLLVWATDVIE